MDYFGIDIIGGDIMEHYNIYAIDKENAKNKAIKKFITYQKNRGIDIDEKSVKIKRIRNSMGERI